MILIVLLIAIIAGGYFAFRYFTLCHALCKVGLELQEIKKDLTQNRILHLPLPNKSLEMLLGTVNSTLAELKTERLNYRKREKEFQQQIAHISHDLRTPLTVILGYLKYIKKMESTEKLAEALGIIEQKAQAMSRLVAQFYDFSLLSAQGYACAIQELDACRMLREALLGSYQLLEEKRLDVEAHLPNCPIPAKGDPEALERIFANLFQNAGRYASAFLKIELSQQPEKVCITFTNDAGHCTPEDIPYLFERFYRKDPARSQSGTGLGLTIAKSLAEAMGGSLTAELIEGEGAAPALQFTLVLMPL